MIVSVSAQFIKGNWNSEYFIDIPHLSQAQRELLRNFIEDVRENKRLLGKNKSSWQDNQKREIPDTELYKQSGCWHYHCGPYNSDTPKCYTVNLEWNIDGLTSSAVLHYQKISQDEIFLLAYSPKHVPFPKENMPDNPLFNRLQ